MCHDMVEFRSTQGPPGLTITLLIKRARNKGTHGGHLHEVLKQPLMMETRSMAGLGLLAAGRLQNLRCDEGSVFIKVMDMQDITWRSR